MVMKYPQATAAAKALPKPRPGSQGPWPQRPLRITPSRVPGVTFPKAPIPKRFGLKLVGRLGTRLIPIVGYGLLAWDLYDAWQAYSAYWPHFGWYCTGSRPLPVAHHDHGASAWITSGFDPTTVGKINQFWSPGPGSPPVTATDWGRMSCAIDHSALPNSRSGLKVEHWKRSIVTNSNLNWYRPVVPVLPDGLPNADFDALGVRIPRARPWADAFPGVGEQPSAEADAAEAPNSRPIWEVPVLPMPIVLVPGVTPGGQEGDFPAPSPAVQEIVVARSAVGSSIRTNSRARTNSERRNKRPSKREKEKKIHVRTVAPGTWALINVITEAMDFLDVIWASLPKEFRTRRAKPHEKARDIYDHFDKIDVALAVENYINNQIEDYVYGMIGKKVAKAQNIIGSPTGLSRSLRQQQKGALEAGDLEVELPEIHFDQQTGEIYLTGFGLSSR